MVFYLLGILDNQSTIEQLCVDSRLQSFDSASHPDFKLDSLQYFLMPEDTGLSIDDVCIPHSRYTIQASGNTLLVVTYDVVVYFVAIDSGNYSVKDLGVAIVDARSKK